MEVVQIHYNVGDVHWSNTTTKKRSAGYEWGPGRVIWGFFFSDITSILWPIPLLRLEKSRATLLPVCRLHCRVAHLGFARVANKQTSRQKTWTLDTRSIWAHTAVDCCNPKMYNIAQISRNIVMYWIHIVLKVLHNAHTLYCLKGWKCQHVCNVASMLYNRVHWSAILCAVFQEDIKPML